MRSITKASLAAGLMSLFAAGSALAQPASINISISPDFSEDAEKLGQRDVELQVEDLTTQINRALANHATLTGSDINLVITDLQPNRPTSQQMIDRPGLDSMRSFSIGGAAIEGTVTLADGTVQPVKFRYYTPHIRDSQGTATWTDANRAYSRLARNLSEGRFVSR